jgi:putative transposase
MISFKGKHSEKEIILTCVRWYLAYALSYRDLEEIMLERGVKIDHTTIYRWVFEYSALLENELKKKKDLLVVAGEWMKHTLK